MKIVLLNSPSANPQWMKDIEGEYQKKISAYFPFEIKKLISKKKSERANFSDKRSDEGSLFLKEIHERDYVILLDETGKNFSSVAFAKQFERILGMGKQRICFVIGGAYGVDPLVKKRADLTLSLSTFVMNHLVANIVTLEQVYRALTIIHNIPYHNI